MYMKVIRASLVSYAWVLVRRLKSSNDKQEIRGIAHKLVYVFRLLDYIDNGRPL